tara:strand:- start:3641 stop:3772 length:132 start_codon:yes stop_codon:yes gene_type:complete
MRGSVVGLLGESKWVEAMAWDVLLASLKRRKRKTPQGEALIHK